MKIIFRYHSNNRHDNYTSCVFHWHYKCYYEKLERVIEMITWSWNADTMRKIISGQNHIMQHQSQIMLLIRWFPICQCCLCHHGTHKHIWKKIYGSYPNKKFWNSLPLISVRNYTVVLCNDSMGNSFFFLWTLWCCLKRPYDKKSFNISTAYDVRFSRYRPSNVITEDFALVLVFINFLWAVCVCRKQLLWTEPHTYMQVIQYTAFPHFSLSHTLI